MSVQSGVMFFDGRPGSDECPRLVEGLQPHAADGVTTFSADGVAMAYGAFHVWTGESSIRQPLRLPSGLVMTWDGRLDNRDDLMVRLEGRFAVDTSDAAIALLVFERWGIDGLRALIGDWSAVIWDGCSRTLHMARDYMGVRPLYYAIGSQSVMWSTGLGELAIRAERVDSLDETFVADFLALRFSTEVTPYKSIHAVPTATCVSISLEGRSTRRRFWEIAQGTVRYRDKRQYEEHLRALWIEAVGSRLRTDAHLWAELSGGLDSSSVVCMVNALIESGRVPVRPLRLVSHVTLDSPEGDERRFIAEVEARVGVSSQIVGVEEHQHVTDPDLEWVTPFAARGVALAMAQRVHRAGGRLVLSGRAGDAVMGCEPDNSAAVLDDIAESRMLTALSNLRLWSRASRKPFGEVACALVKAQLQTRRSAPRTSEQLALREANIDLLAPGLARIARDRSSIHMQMPPVRAAQRRFVAQLLGYSQAARLNLPMQLPNVTFAYPFVHRPLVEYMLAIPGEELSSPSSTRSLMRRAFEGLVPSRVLRRTSKGHYAPSAMRGARLLAASMPPAERFEVVQRGWMDSGRLRAAIRELTEGGARTGDGVRRVLMLEQWLISRDRRGPAATPIRKEVIHHAVCNA